MRFSLADQQGWLDGGTVRLIFKLTNLHVTGSLQPIVDSPASMFRRMRLIANGSAVIEDIEEYGRVHQMFSELLPSQRRYNDVTEAWEVPPLRQVSTALCTPTKSKPTARGPWWCTL